jgi:hypothetical protein
MHVAPEGRYRDVGSFAEALRDFRAGRGAWTPLVHETFGDDSFRERWVTPSPGDYKTKGGRLIVDASEGGLLVFRHRFASGVAIEFDGEILEDGRAGDLTVMWSDDDIVDGDAARWPRAGTTFELKTGGYDNAFAGIYKSGRCIAGIAHSLEKGRVYRIRTEIDGPMLRLMLDGEVLAEYEELFPIATGFVAIMTFYQGKAISNVRIFERGFAEHVRPTAVGDYAYGRGDFVDAARQYGRIEAVLGASQLVEEARYKRGLALFAAREQEKAREAWSGLHEPGLVARTRVHEADIAFEAGDHERVLAILREVLDSAPALRPFVINRWADCASRYAGRTDVSVEPYLALRDQQFPDDVASEPAAAGALYQAARYEEVIARFPRQGVPVSLSLIALGRPEDLVAMHPEGTWLHSYGLLLAGWPDRVREGASLYDVALIYQGKPEEALRRGDGAFIQVANGRYENVGTESGAERMTALRRLGRRDEAVALGDVRAMVEAGIGEEILERTAFYWDRAYALRYLAIRAFLAGDTAACRRFQAMAKAVPFSFYWESTWVHEFVVFPLIDELAGQRGAVRAALEVAVVRHPHTFRGALAPAARYILGSIDDARFLSQPLRAWAQGRLFVCQAVRAEIESDRERAAEAYRCYLALPDLERGIDCVHGDPVLDLWARARAGALSSTA